MKTAIKPVFLVVVAACMTFSNTGCATKPKAVPYSFAGDSHETASVTFEAGSKFSVGFRTFEGEKLPEPSPGTVWAPEIFFPAGVELTTLVHVYYDGRDHFAWTGAVLGGLGGAAYTNGDAAFFLLIVIPVVIARDILWSPVIIADIATASKQATNRDVILVIPPLENDRKYKVYFKRKGKRYVIYVQDKLSGKIVHEQEFERVIEN